MTRGLLFLCSLEVFWTVVCESVFTSLFLALFLKMPLVETSVQIKWTLMLRLILRLRKILVDCERPIPLDCSLQEE